MIAFTGDNHLGDGVRTALAPLREDSYRAMADMIRTIYQISPRPEGFVLAGDVFTRDVVRGKDIKLMLDSIDSLYDADIPVYFIEGNHDRNQEPILGSLGAENIDRKLVTLPSGLKLYGLSYRREEELMEELLKVPECDVLVLHQGFEHLLGFNGMFELTVDDIPSRVKNVFVGHVHVRDERALPSGKCVSPGSTVACSLNQSSPKGFYTFDGKDWAFREIPYRRIFKMSIGDEGDLPGLKDVLESVPSLDRPPIVSLKYPEEMYDAVEEIFSGYPEDSVIRLADDRLSAEVAEEYEEAGNDIPEDEMSMEYMLQFEVCRESRPRVFSLASELLTSKAPDAVLSAWTESIHRNFDKEVLT